MKAAFQVVVVLVLAVIFCAAAFALGYLARAGFDELTRPKLSTATAQGDKHRSITEARSSARRGFSFVAVVCPAPLNQAAGDASPAGFIPWKASKLGLGSLTGASNTGATAIAPHAAGRLQIFARITTQGVTPGSPVIPGPLGNALGGWVGPSVSGSFPAFHIRLSDVA